MTFWCILFILSVLVSIKLIDINMCKMLILREMCCFVSETFAGYGSNKTNVWQGILTPSTLAFSCEVVHEKLWKTVYICKSYSKKKISGTFLCGHVVVAGCRMHDYIQMLCVKQSHCHLHCCCCCCCCSFINWWTDNYYDHLTAAYPDAPQYVEVISKTWESIELQWTPSFDGGYEQQFVIVIITVSSTRQSPVKIPTNSSSNYNITGVIMFMKLLCSLIAHLAGTLLCFSCLNQTCFVTMCDTMYLLYIAVICY